MTITGSTVYVYKCTWHIVACESIFHACLLLVVPCHAGLHPQSDMRDGEGEV